MRIFFFDQTAACAFIRIDKFTDLTFGLGTEHYMDMVCIMIPFFKDNSIGGCNIRKQRLIRC